MTGTTPQRDAAREVSRFAYALGTAALFAPLRQPGEDAGKAARAALERATDEIVRQCLAQGLDEGQKDFALGSLLKGFNEAAYPADALRQAFAKIRDYERAGGVLVAPFMLTRGRGEAYPRLFCAALVIGFDDADPQADPCRPFPFACNFTAAAYTEAFADRIDPMLVLRFIKAAVPGVLEIVQQGTRGAHGKPTVCRFKSAATAAAFARALPPDMMLRRAWTVCAHTVRAAVDWCG